MKSIVIEPRPALTATEARLEAIYKAAKRGLKGDNLAVTAGMLPEDYRRLTQNDPLAAFAEMRGRADGELEASEQLHAAAAQGDAKAAAFILTHAHGWVGKQQLQITQTTISITAALEQAQQRLEHAEANLRPGRGTVIDVEAMEPRGRS
jgi:hypothetical protein